MIGEKKSDNIITANIKAVIVRPGFLQYSNTNDFFLEVHNITKMYRYRNINMCNIHTAENCLKFNKLYTKKNICTCRRCKTQSEQLFNVTKHKNQVSNKRQSSVLMMWADIFD